MAEGRQTNAKDAVDEVLGQERIPNVRDSDAEVARRTPPEREIVALIGRSVTRAQIARALAITERTADAHTDNIRGTLGLHLRAEIAAWAT